LRHQRSIIQTGIIEGRAEGRAEGLAEGEAIGEYKKAITIAQKLLEKGMSFEDVSETTGLSIQQIEELQKDNQ